MAFSFSKWFKKSGPNAEQPGHGQPVAPPAPAVAPAPAAPPAPAPAPVAQLPAARNVKTVMPNSVRPVNLHDGTRAFPPGSPSSVSLRNASPPAPSASVNRTVSFPGLTGAATPAAPAAPEPAPAPAAALPEPPPDAAIALTLGDFVDRIPASLLKAGAPVDRNREVVFQAADLYSDLARGRASVPVSTIQSVCPDLFGRPVTDTEDVEIALPLPKLVEQLGAALQTRSDQVAEEDVGEIETPFLQVALEDSVRLPKPPASPTPAAPKTVSPVAPQAVVRKPLSSVIPPPAAPAPAQPELGQTSVRALSPRSQNAPAPVGSVPPPAPSISAPTAQSVTPIGAGTKRPPSTVRASVAGGKIRLSGPAISSRSIAPVSANSATPAPLAPSAPPAVKSIPAPMMPSSAASAPAQKKTARIQIPPIALRSGSGGGSNGVPSVPPPSSRPPGAVPLASGGRSAGPTGKAMPFPEPLVSFRATPSEAPTPGTPPAPPPMIMPSSRALPMTVPLAPSVARMPIAPPPFPAAPSFAPPPAPGEPAAVAAPDAPPIALALAPILRGQPAALFAEGLDGEAAANQVPDDARVHFPMPFITSQLAQGRVAVPRAMFTAAMPEALRHLVPEEGEPAEVTIPLQEVFQNLPMGALTHRHDQVTEELGPQIPTPFSMKAEEDAERLRASASPDPAAESSTVVEEVTSLAEPMVEPTPETLALTEPRPEAEVIPPADLPESHPEVATPFAEAAPEPVAVETPAAEQTPTEAATTLEAPVQEPELLPAFTLEPTANVAPKPLVESLDEPAFPVETPHPEFEALAIETELPAEPANTDGPAHLEMPAAETPTPEPVASDETQPGHPGTEVLDEPAPPVKTMPPLARVHLPTLETPIREIAPAAYANGTKSTEPVSLPAPPVTYSAEEVQDALRNIFMVDDDLDAKKIVKLVGQMPGLKACAIMFGDGLKLAGELDGILSGEGFSAMTPAFFRRVGSYAQELELGEIQSVTLQTERTLLSFFMHGDVCLSVQHAGNRGFLPGVREKLLAATRELAWMYATPAPGR